MTENMTSAETREETRTYPYMVLVRFENSTRSYSFGTENADLREGDSVVVETSQGIELGKVTADAVSTVLQRCPRAALKPVLRKATDYDKQCYEENQYDAKEAFRICQDEIKDLGLGMHLLSAEYLLDRSKILFVYQSEQRVDFRELLKRLGSRLHCRIELRQIGERDKAKMVGGIGMCGMECCCSRFKSKMEVVSINMAKTQLLALNTEKLSGMCGKLMCCLRYENENYKELTEGLPKMGAHVEYEGAMYRVTSMNVMSNEARLENSETFQEITLDELREKAVVRKGVTVGRKAPGRAPRREPGAAPGVHKSNISGTPVSTNFKTSEESKKHESAPLRPERKNNARPNKPKDMHAGLKPQNGTNNSNKKNASSRPQNNKKQNVRRPNHVDTNNPNVTVRSFKSSHTKAREAKGGAQ